MSHVKPFTFGFLLVAAAAAGGCTAPFESPETTETESSGLTFDTRTAEHVAGRFIHEDTVLVFDIEKRGEAREATLTSSAGAPLVRATLSADGVETLLLLGGRAKVSGARRDADPTIEGDRAAIAELSAMREVKLIDRMREALQKAGVSADLVAPARDVGLQSQAAMNVTYTVYPDSYPCFPTWSFWYPTNIFLRNTTQMPYLHYQWQRDEWMRKNGGRASARLEAGASFEFVGLSPGESVTLTRYYWGVPVCVDNMYTSPITFSIRVW